MSSGTNKQRLDQNNTKIEQLTQALNRKVIGEGNYDTAKGLADGTLTEFVASDFGVTSLMPYRFQNFTSLTKLDLRGITNIPEYTAYQDTGLTELILDENITNIGQYAFYRVGLSAQNAAFDLVCNNLSVGYYAFGYSKLRSIKGSLRDLGNFCFSYNSTLTEIDVKISGSSAGAFLSNEYVNSFNLDRMSNITTLANGSFRMLGNKRENPQNNIFIFDLRNSTFRECISFAFGGESTINTNKYFNIFFPVSLNTVQGDSFRYTDYLNIYYKSVPTLSNTGAFIYATNFKNFFPYNLVYTAKNSTNWSSSTNGIVSSIYGYAEENTFSLGDTLPADDGDGHSLVWYSDREMTTQVTTVSDPTQIYYCNLV